MFHQNQEIQENLSWIKTRSNQEIGNLYQDKTKNCYQDQDFLTISQEILRNFRNKIIKD